MSNLHRYAEAELKKAFPDESDTMQQAVIQNILELIDTFSDQHHSGMSGSYVLKYFDRLVRWNPLLPLTGEDDEWREPFGDDNNQQNKRCGKIFRKNFDNSTAHNIEGKVFVDKDGISFTNRDSWTPVVFPYTVPEKPEYIHIDMDEEKGE